MFAKHPGIAERFAIETKNIKSLPEKKMKSKTMPKFQAAKEELSMPRMDSKPMKMTGKEPKKMKGSKKIKKAKKK
jgi:hypothetical protein